jgi:hypothetical protein
MTMAPAFTAAVLQPARGAPGSGPARRATALDEQAVLAALAEFRATHAGATAPELAAIALLWHDHLDPAHALVQDLETAIGMHLHGVMHRREGDFGNARYWFHRAGRVAALDELVPAARVAGAAFLVPGGRWNSEAFVDAHASSADDVRWIALQATELRALAEALGAQ